jgi:hypothetical protein
MQTRSPYTCGIGEFARRRAMDKCAGEAIPGLDYFKVLSFRLKFRQSNPAKVEGQRNTYLLPGATITVFFMYHILFFAAFGAFSPVAPGLGAWRIVHKPVTTRVDMNYSAAHG